MMHDTAGFWSKLKEKKNYRISSWGRHDATLGRQKWREMEMVSVKIMKENLKIKRRNIKKNITFQGWLKIFYFNFNSISLSLQGEFLVCHFNITITHKRVYHYFSKILCCSASILNKLLVALLRNEKFPNWECLGNSILICVFILCRGNYVYS